MSKNIILQHFTGKLRTLDKLSVENIKAYAERIGVDYSFVEGQVFREHLTPPCQKAFILDEKWDEYDNVLMLDIDMFVTKGLHENVFNSDGVGHYGEVQKRLQGELHKRHRRINADSGYWSGAFYKLTREQRIALREAIPLDNEWMDLYNKPYHYEDEGIIAELFHRTGTEWTNADPRWQQDSYLHQMVSSPQVKPGMIHVRTKITPQGPKQDKLDNYYALQMKGII